MLSAFTIVILILRWQVFRPARHLLLICGIVSFMWTVFLLWTYSAVFSLEDTARAASTWRYLAQLGPMLLLVCFVMLAAAMPVNATVETPRPLVSTKGAIVVATYLMPALFIIATRSHWQIDSQYPLKSRMRSVATIIAPVVAAKHLTVVHPVDALEVAVEVDYDLHRPSGSSVPSQLPVQGERQGLVLDITGFEGTRCPRLLFWAGSEWDDVTPTDLVQYCRRLNLASG